MTDAIQTVREAVKYRTPTSEQRGLAALDRVEAVVEAARGVMHGGSLTVLYRALAALDSTEDDRAAARAYGLGWTETVPRGDSTEAPDEEGYVAPGPDPQTVDPELNRLLRGTTP